MSARPESSSGVFQTSPGLLRRRLVGPWGEGLAQYLALRLGDGALGRAAYASLLRALAALPPEELLEAPGPKARLYRLARSIAETERVIPRAKRIGVLPWRDLEGTRGAAIDRLRAELSSGDAELLELRHARELSVAEIACVVEAAADEVELWLDTAEARARQIAGEHAPDPLAARATLYVEAFALVSGWNEQDGEALAELDVEPLEAGTIIGGRYALAERVGTGAFGDVYRADDTEVPGHRVALKLLRQPSLSESARQSALRELRMNAAVFHPSLVQFKDHGWFDQRLWFVMPWYEGETLDRRLRRDALDRKEARRIFVPLARALAALHAVGIRHQDIKPENILLTRLPGQDEVLPVLIDLGVAADAREGLLAGTPLYFAPEVAARFAKAGSPHEVGPAADVFALALALRNALEPSTREDVAAGAVEAFVERRASEAPGLPEARSLRFLNRAWARWLSVDPSERPSAEELAEELAILTAPEERRARRVRVMRWLVPLLIGLAGVFGVVVHQLEARAAERALEAERAQHAAADARADLVVSDARRRAIEEGHAELLARYEQSRMSRRELADRLATSEGQVRIVQDSLARTIATQNELEAALALREQERDAARAEASAHARALEESRAAREGELLRAQERERELERATAEARAEQSAAERAHREVERALGEAERAHARTQAELERVRAQIDRLAAQMRAFESAVEQPPEPAETDATPSEAPTLEPSFEPSEASSDEPPVTTVVP